MAIDHTHNQPAPAAIDVRAAAGLCRAIDERWISNQLRRAAEALAAHEGTITHRVSALIVDDARMTQLHTQHSNIATTTDVLTFDARDDASQPVDVDIVVCVDEAARRCSEFGHPLEQELLLYCVHGLLHCAGYDDHSEDDWRAMHAREDEILRAIGVGATFCRPDPPDAEDHP